MSLATIRARLRRMEQARQAHDNRPATADELRAEAAGQPEETQTKSNFSASESAPWPAQ